MADGDDKASGADTPGFLRCWIYKDGPWGQTYLYLAQEDGFDAAPPGLIERMGRLQFVMELELHAGRKLARADVAQVMKALDEKGYYLQLPPVKPPGGERLQ